MILALRGLDLDELGRALASAQLLPWLPLGILCYLAGHVVRGFRTARLVRHEAELSLSTATSAVVLGYAVNNIAPARAGEFARAGMLAERAQVPYATGLSLTFLERVIDGLTILLFLLISALLTATTSAVTGMAVVAAVIFGIALAAIFALLWAPVSTATMVARIAGIFGPDSHTAAMSFALSSARGIEQLGRSREAAIVLLASVVVWLLEAGLFFFLLPAFGFGLDPFVAVLVMAATNLGILVPSSPGYIGTFHFFCIQALAILGITGASALGFALVVHLAFYIPITLWGFGIILSYGMTLGSTSRAGHPLPGSILEAGPHEITIVSAASSGTPAEIRPEAFLTALVEALIPTELASTEGHEQLVAETSTFVAEQVGHLPSPFREAFRCGLLFLATTCLVSALHPFAGLPREQRRARVEKWSHSNFAVRGIIRLLRFNTLFFVYEHNRVHGESRAR